MCRYIIVKENKKSKNNQKNLPELIRRLLYKQYETHKKWENVLVNWFTDEILCIIKGKSKLSEMINCWVK